MAHPIIRKVAHSFERRFDEEIRFFRGWLDSPKAVGSIIPTSDATSARMASVIDLTSGLPVLELGPGTGVITRAILRRGVRPERLVSVEHSRQFADALRRAHPRVHVIEGDAFNLQATLGELASAQFDCVISGIPLLSFPMAMRESLIEDALDRIPRGRPMVQITYGPRSPVRPTRTRRVKHFDFMLRNVPPAQLWLYSRPAY
ncbi:MAG: methyltransferase domain-containing protein [Rhizobiaceae bacterium]|jgi:phosphatidylethanolamine/phosphatidyl-N-methylethanolamine N-methyltransferase|nr:methyltransferase domain-containing protein [Rhizobiaceae bacterium]